MIPALEHLAKKENESFVYRFFDYECFPTPWHYHPEFELVLVISSSGTRYIGTHVTEFSENDLCFIGSNVPHTYKNFEKFYQKENCERAQSIVIHFTEESFGGCLDLPELKHISQFLKDNKNAYQFTGTDRDKIAEILKNMERHNEVFRWYSLIEILDIMAKSSGKINLLSNDTETINTVESARLHKVFEYIKNNYYKEIKLADLANMVHMTETSFSRFFIQRTRKSFTEYLIEFRLTKAAKLLLETEENVETIAQNCGFFNISNFNRHFKKINNVTPTQYRKVWRSGMNL